VWAYWGRPDRPFLGWYVNIQVPFQRTPIGIDSLDLELDLLVTPTYEVVVKDEEHVGASAALGRYTEDDAVAIHAVGARVRAEIEAGDRWWDERWSRWVPSPELLVPPELPSGWQDVPAEAVTDLGLG
jgi:predicted RNA-binding protein associated with RNAse of E/G family